MNAWRLHSLAIIAFLAPVLSACPLPAGQCDGPQDCATGLQECVSGYCRNLGGLPTPSLGGGGLDDVNCVTGPAPSDTCGGITQIDVNEDTSCVVGTASLSGFAVPEGDLLMCGGKGTDALFFVSKTGQRGTIRVELTPPPDVDGFLNWTGEVLGSCSFADSGCRDSRGPGEMEFFQEQLPTAEAAYVLMGFRGSRGEFSYKVTFEPEE